MFTISTLKNLVVRTRRSVKLITLLIIATLIISGIFLFVYRPIYAVTLNGEFIGYSENKTKLQSRINEFMENGDPEKNIAFVQIDDLPEYELCLLKKDVVTNDEEIFEKITSNGTVYYEYYALTVEDEEKNYVASYDAAKDVMDQLKEKGSGNLDKLGMAKKYATELVVLTETEVAIDNLYEKPVVVEQPKVNTGIVSYRKDVNMTSQIADLGGMSIIRPLSGVITSRFGYRSSGLHSGLDIGAPTGTDIKVISDGVVSFSGWTNTGYGYYVVVDHEDGIQTLYAHCSALYVQAGTKVSQGQVIAAVGSTGNSTGPHLHLEIRTNRNLSKPTKLPILKNMK